MKTYCFSLLFFCISYTLFADDAYHTSIRNQLQTEYSLSGGSWVFADNELDKTNQYNGYNVIMNNSNVTGLPFTQAKNINVTVPGQFIYSNSVIITSNTPVNMGDRVLLVFWGKAISGANGSGTLNITVERSGPPYDKQLTTQAQFSTTSWTQFMIPFEATTSYASGELQFAAQVGHQIQEVQLGGMALLNFGTSYQLNQLPEKNFKDYYAGIEPNAQWRINANNRIDQFRKANLTVRVADQQGNPVNGVTVDVDMDCHSYAFGSAVQSTWFAGNHQHSAIYEDKIVNMDGNGHGFNMIVFENSLKWRAWEGNWPGSQAEKITAINWLQQRNIKIRGHTMLWPSWQFMPDRMQQNQNNPAYLIQQIDNHFNTILTNPDINGKIEEWDVVNEMTFHHELQNALQGYAHYNTGREIYPEVFMKSAQLDPAAKRYINDFVTLSYGGTNKAFMDTYTQYLDELHASTSFEGIGFQAHISTFPVPPTSVYSILDDFYTTYGKEMKITEFDMKAVDQSIGYEYMRDFLTATFSHEGTNGFLIWGFWDGLHWLNSAPIYDINWNLKPSGQAFIDQIFDVWWTDEQATTASNGETTIRGFKGKHTVTINYNGQTQTIPVVLENDQIINVTVMGNSCLPAGTPCNDNDATTASDIEDGNCVCAGSPIVNNSCTILTNGDFSNGLTDWAAYGGGTVQLVNEEAHIDVVTPGTDPWNVNFKQTGFTVEQSSTYQISFSARASVNRTIRVKVGEADPPFTGYYYETANLTTDMNDYTFTFTMTDPTQTNAAFEFFLGQESGDVVIDNVELEDVTCVADICDIVGPESFTTGLGGFVCDSCTAFSSNGEAFIVIPAQTASPLDVSFAFGGANLEFNKQYEITFDARADFTNLILVRTRKSYPPIPYSISAFTLSTTMKTYRTIFTMSYSDDPIATFEFLLGHSPGFVYIDNVHIREVSCGPTTQVELKLFLEGCYNNNLYQMNSFLNSSKLLPGQKNNTNLTLPYASAPWNYVGTEATMINEFAYSDIGQNNGFTESVDWVLVEFRTSPHPSTSVGQKAALVLKNGTVVFPEPVDFLVDGQSYYVKADHWSHNGIMSPTPVQVINKKLVFDFTTQNSYQSGAGFPSKEIMPGVWAMYGGNCDQKNEIGYDINGGDRQAWNTVNGMFNVYHPADMNMDGEISGSDRILWDANNGIFSDLLR